MAEQTAQAAGEHDIEIREGEEGEYNVYDPSTYFDQNATSESLESVVQQAISNSDRVYGK